VEQGFSIIVGKEGTVTLGKGGGKGGDSHPTVYEKRGHSPRCVREGKAGDAHFGITGGCRGKVCRCMGQRPLSLGAVGTTLLMRCLVEVGVPLCALRPAQDAGSSRVDWVHTGGCLYKNNKWKCGFRGFKADFVARKKREHTSKVS